MFSWLIINLKQIVNALRVTQQWIKCTRPKDIDQHTFDCKTLYQQALDQKEFEQMVLYLKTTYKKTLTKIRLTKCHFSKRHLT